MGAADVVPGVSGGTIAFITGIYEELLDSIRSVNGEAIKLLLRFRIADFWRHINGNFLVVLLAGIGFSVATLSRIILFLLDNYPELLWSFFFGLIVASAVVVGKKITQWTAGVVLLGLAGAAIAYYVTVATPTQTPEAYWFIFLSGAIAICAMILPGISGSFLLVLLAKYEFILNAVKELRVGVIAVFGLGCIVGILSFSHVLNWALKHYHNATVALLTGFMVGSLNKVWPWKETIETYTDRHGEVKPLVQENVLPGAYEALTGQESYLVYAIVLAIFGFLLVYLIDHYTDEGNTASV
ncbi:putative membrane protein [Pontibacter ummariensis]|uniref:Putative membrane protein n=2 Tax=Pontibacter ummariensis TaxID=1610492 RepID=A0A239H9C4_9BACT|nr:putative membrane protein [Pontibacter ummariensis]SNS77862.1 putative membrane protein [Pontibacter ummariensis]